MSNTPPPDVAAAAAKIRAWLDAPTVKTREEIAKMTPAQRLDYAQSFDQKKMPDNTLRPGRAK